MKIAIIGAGLSGANSYYLLKKDAHELTLFEKSRGIGGRCSTKYIDDKRIDHGTPFFEASSKLFAQFCEDKVQEHILIKKQHTYYPTNGMNSLCSSLIEKENLLKNTKIVSCVFKEKKWYLKDDKGVEYSAFDRLILTIPAPQILQLDISLPKELKEKLQSVSYDSIASLILYAKGSNKLNNDILLDKNLFKKVLDNSSKYHYKDFSSYLLHLNKTLSNIQNFQNKKEVEAFILEKISKDFSVDISKKFHIIPHLWKYALVSKSLKEPFIYEKNLSIGLCGDYFKYKNLEGAYLSARYLYEQFYK